MSNQVSSSDIAAYLSEVKKLVSTGKYDLLSLGDDADEEILRRMWKRS